MARGWAVGNNMVVGRVVRERLGLFGVVGEIWVGMVIFGSGSVFGLSGSGLGRHFYIPDPDLNPVFLIRVQAGLNLEKFGFLDSGF